MSESSWLKEQLDRIETKLDGVTTDCARCRSEINARVSVLEDRDASRGVWSKAAVGAGVTAVIAWLWQSIRSH